MKEKCILKASLICCLLLNFALCPAQNTQCPWLSKKEFNSFSTETTSNISLLKTNVNTIEQKVKKYDFKQTKINEGDIEFLNTSNQTIAQIGETDSHDGFARFWEEDGSECAYIGTMTGGGGAVNVFNTVGISQILLTTHKDGGRIMVYNEKGDLKIDIGLYDGSDDGYIMVNGNPKDYSETFELKTRENVIPGTVMSMDDKGGGLVPTEKAYDPKVVGVISGAGGLQTGMQIGSRRDGSNDLPVAVSGQVYVRICMENGPIEVGDLLAASSIPGVAMKASGIEKTTGTVVGKALEPYNEPGKKEGLVLMLVMMR
jgi:hypothetical protein